jgi:aryl-alcohol dehydrogenase-like predicted oxidoreductase
MDTRFKAMAHQTCLRPEAIESFAKEHGASPEQMAVAYATIGSKSGKPAFEVAMIGYRDARNPDYVNFVAALN